MNGVLVINKPAGYTSFDVVAVIRKLTSQRKAGHTGTLDPNATGVLPVLLGSATKAQDLILNQDKAYIADFKLGVTTDTLDIWGSVTEQKPSDVSEDELKKIMTNFKGEIEQVPPMFSAVQKDGKRLYEFARHGVEIERESRKVTVYSLELLSFDEKEQSGRIEVSCSKGTYIRSIIDDMGRALGTGAVMTSLVRTSACGFTLDDCISLDEAKSLAEKNMLAERVRSVESLFAECSQLDVSDAQARRFSNGGALDLSRTSLKNADNSDGEIFRVKSRSGDFLGLGRVDKSTGELKIYLHQ